MSARFKSMKSGPLPMKRGRLIKSIADHTIRNVVDAIIELITNSDDSYLIAEEDGKNLSGRVDIYVVRGKGGKCKEFSVRDEALGMDPQTLEKAIEFSGETSGFSEGRTVRGFFGRGLKESIIALGRGSILTLQDGILSKAEIFYDKDKRDAHYDLSIPVANLSPDELLELGFITSSGTIATIKVANEKRNYISAAHTLADQIANHYALRDINSSSKRKLLFTCKDFGRREWEEVSVPLKYIRPVGKTVFNKRVNLDKSNRVHFKIFESKEQLDSPSTPFGKAGLLIKTEAAILDNQLFGYEIDPAGLYFFGEIVCPGIAQIIRKGDDSIVDFNRGGLAWDHEYSKKLEEKSKEIMSKLVKEKGAKLDKKELSKVPTTVEKMLDKLCRALGKLAKDELVTPEPQPEDIMSLMTVPMFANIELEKPRAFSVYAPQLLIEQEGTKIVKIHSSNKWIDVINPATTLKHHKKYEGIFRSDFKIVGRKEGETGTISAKLGSLIATSEARVGPQTVGRKRKKLKPRGGGIFRKIIPSTEENPIQRFKYEEEGVIKIYVKFPGVDKYLGESFKGLIDPEGKMLLAEILVEAFSNYVARKKAGKEFEEEIDRYVYETNRLKRKCTEVVYGIVFGTSLKDLKKSFQIR